MLLRGKFVSRIVQRGNNAASRDVVHNHRRVDFAVVVAQKTSMQQTIQHHTIFLQLFHPFKFMKMRKNLIRGSGNLVECKEALFVSMMCMLKCVK
jgi:hypothetical protein